MFIQIFIIEFYIFRDPVKRLLSDYHHEQRLLEYKRFTDDPKEEEFFHRIEKDHSFEELVFSTDGNLNFSYEPVQVRLVNVGVKRTNVTKIQTTKGQISL